MAALQAQTCQQAAELCSRGLAEQAGGRGPWQGGAMGLCQLEGRAVGVEAPGEQAMQLTCGCMSKRGRLAEVKNN